MRPVITQLLAMSDVFRAMPSELPKPIVSYRFQTVHDEVFVTDLKKALAWRRRMNFDRKAKP